MKKFMFLLMVVFVLALAACGTSDDDNAGGSSDGNNSDSQENTDKEETNGSQDAQEQIYIGITQIVEHPSLDAAQEGFIAALKDNGYVDGENLELDVQIAQGDMNNNKTIAQKFVGDKADLILGISTPSAQSVLSETKDIPVLFTAITDPVGAQLVESFENPGGNATGTSDTHPDAIKNTMETIAKFFPDAKNVGIIYNSGEQNSEVNVENAKEVMPDLGLEPVEVSVSTSAEVKQAAESLVGRVDVIYVPKDNTVVSALESVIDVANSEDIPLFVGESDSVKRGGFAGFGFEYFDLGYQTGEMAIDILKNGKSPSEIPVTYPDTLELVINVAAAKEQGIELTDEMKENAVLVGE
jgi:putative ABC transport system substrate-binding protein